MNFSTTSRDIFNMIVYNLSMEDVWNVSQVLRKKCDDDFWKRQLRYRFPRLKISNNLKKQFGNIIGFLKKLGGKTWFIKFSENLLDSFYKNSDPYNYTEIKIVEMKQVPDNLYQPTSYCSNVECETWNLDWKECEAVIISKSETPVIPGQKIWIATGWNEDYLNFGMILDSLETAKKYLIENAKIIIENDISESKHLEILQEDLKLAKLAKENYISAIEEKGCFHYSRDRAFRIFEHIIEN